MAVMLSSLVNSISIVDPDATKEGSGPFPQYLSSKTGEFLLFPL